MNITLPNHSGHFNKVYTLALLLFYEILYISYKEMELDTRYHKLTECRHKSGMTKILIFCNYVHTRLYVTKTSHCKK